MKRRRGILCIWAIWHCACLCLWLGTNSERPRSFRSLSHISELAKPVFLPKKRSSCWTCFGFISFFKKRPSLGSPKPMLQPSTGTWKSRAAFCKGGTGPCYWGLATHSAGSLAGASRRFERPNAGPASAAAQYKLGPWCFKASRINPLTGCLSL